MMQTDFFISLVAQMFKLALQIALPLLISTLVIGVIISIFQVVTQIQEATLTFVPKIVIFLIVLALAGPWMLDVLIEFSHHTISGIKDI